jgi:hypothetical protein
MHFEPYISHQRFDYGDNGEMKNWEELVIPPNSGGQQNQSHMYWNDK